MRRLLPVFLKPAYALLFAITSMLSCMVFAQGGVAMTGDRVDVRSPQISKHVQAYLESVSLPLPGNSYSAMAITKAFGFERDRTHSHYPYPMLIGKKYESYVSYSKKSSGEMSRVILMRDEKVLAVIVKEICSNSYDACESRYTKWRKFAKNTFKVASESSTIVNKNAKVEDLQVNGIPWQVFMYKWDPANPGKEPMEIHLLIMNDENT